MKIKLTENSILYNAKYNYLMVIGALYKFYNGPLFRGLNKHWHYIGEL